MTTEYDASLKGLVARDRRRRIQEVLNTGGAALIGKVIEAGIVDACSISEVVVRHGLAVLEIDGVRFALRDGCDPGSTTLEAVRICDRDGCVRATWHTAYNVRRPSDLYSLFFDTEGGEVGEVICGSHRCGKPEDDLECLPF